MIQESFPFLTAFSTNATNQHLANFVSTNKYIPAANAFLAGKRLMVSTQGKHVVHFQKIFTAYDIAATRVTSGEVHLCSKAPGQHRSKKHPWHVVGSPVFDLSGPEIET